MAYRTHNPSVVGRLATGTNEPGDVCAARTRRLWNTYAVGGDSRGLWTRLTLPLIRGVGSPGEYVAKLRSQPRICRSARIWRRSVKPSAQPTLVRTQHLPHQQKQPLYVGAHLIPRGGDQVIPQVLAVFLF